MAYSSSSFSCDELRSPSYANFGISIFILLGILISYLPQHHRIISRRSSEGMSPYFVLLGATSSNSAIANILSLPASHDDLSCCKEVSGFECFAGVLGIAQIGFQWASFTVILLLFLIFFPRATPLAPPKNPKSTPSYRTALFVAVTAILHAFILFLATTIILYKFPSNLQRWADALGVAATCLAAIQFIPQLFTTWRLQAVGSMSIPTMCIQTPGSFVWSASLAKRLGIQGWSTWGIYLVTGILQGMVLTMCISFEIRDRRKQKEECVTQVQGDEHAGGDERGDTQVLGREQPDSEDTALLRNER